MKKSIFLNLFAFCAFLLLASCQNTDVVESGSYQGVISEVEADKDEIYVKTDDGKTLELYFTEETQLMRNGQAADFSALQEDMRVEVEVKKVGQRLDPLRVEILD